MKNKINNYKQFESLLDKLRGPNEEEFIKGITKKNPLKTFGVFKNKDNANNLLILSCEGGSLKGVKLAVENGADIHHSLDGALTISASRGYFDIIKYLETLDVFDISNVYHAIQSSIFSGDSIIMEYIIKNHSDKLILINDISKEELLLECVRRNNLNALKYLISIGYKHHFKDDKLIEIAARMNHYQILDYLISLGDVELYLGDYIYDIAIRNDYKEIIDILKKYDMFEW